MPPPSKAKSPSRAMLCVGHATTQVVPTTPRPPCVPLCQVQETCTCCFTGPQRGRPIGLEGQEPLFFFCVERPVFSLRRGLGAAASRSQRSLDAAGLPSFDTPSVPPPTLPRSAQSTRPSTACSSPMQQPMTVISTTTPAKDAAAARLRPAAGVNGGGGGVIRVAAAPHEPAAQKVYYVRQVATPATTASTGASSFVTPSSMKSQPLFGGQPPPPIDPRQRSVGLITPPPLSALATPQPFVETATFTPGEVSQEPCAAGDRLLENSPRQPVLLRNGLTDVKHVVKEFEDLLRIERTQQALALDARDKELERLKAQLCYQQNAARGGEPIFTSQQQEGSPNALRAKEEELRALLREKSTEIDILNQRLRTEERLRTELAACVHKPSYRTTAIDQEVAQLRRLLAHRENQLKQAEAVAETRQQQYQSLLKELALKETLVTRFKQLHPEEAALQSVENKTGVQLDYLETEVTSMRRIIDELAFEKQELQQLLIQKDKQLAAVTGLGVSPNEASAVQLSVQALSMVQNAAELKEQIRVLETELSAMNRRAQEFKERYEENYKKLTEKRQEATMLVEALASRDTRIARLDTALQFREKELMQLRDDTRVAICKERECVAQLQTELKILQETHTKLREELSLRDDNAISLKSEIVRQSRYNQSAEERIKTLASELAEAQKHLQKLIKQNVAKDRYMLDLERRMKENDVRRQATYLAELAKNRRLQLSLRLKEDDCRLALHDKDHEIVNLKSNLKASTNQVAAVKKLLLQSASGILPPSNKGTNSTVPLTNHTETGVQPQTQDPRLTPTKSTKTQHKRATSHKPKDPASQLLRSSPVQEGEKVRPTPTTDSLSSETDLIDVLLKTMLKKPEYRSLKPLFFRLSSGTYLFGAQRVRLRYTDQQELEGQPNVTVDTWLPFDAFVTQLVASATKSRDVD